MNESRPAVAPRRILCVHNTADRYGASRMLLRWLTQADRRQFEPLVVLPCEGPLKVLIEAAGVKVFMHPRLSIFTRTAFGSWRIIPFLFNIPISVFCLWRLIRRNSVAVVYTNTGVIVSPALAARLAGVPHVWHIRESFQEFRRWWPAYSRFIRSFSSHILCVSNAVAAQFQPPGAALVVYDGLSLKEFQVPREALRRDFRTRYGLGDHFVVGCVGRIKFVRKGQEFLVRAVAVLKQRGRPVKALIVGSPVPGNEHHLTRLRDLTRELGVQDCLVFTGEVRDVRPAYTAMDVLALTSAQPEPFGGVVMEAMAMGLPVIATNIGGSLDQVIHGKTGLLIPPADPVALADAIDRVRADAAARAAMGRSGLERIRTRFTPERMTREIEEVLTAAIERRTPDPAIVAQVPAGSARTFHEPRDRQGEEADGMPRLENPPPHAGARGLSAIQTGREESGRGGSAALPGRVLHVHNGADVYGAGRSLLRLIKTIDRQRFQPVVVLPEAGLLKPLLEQQNVEVLVRPGLGIISRDVFHSWRLILFFLRFPFSVLSLRRLIRRRRIDVVHTNTGVVLAPALAAWLAGVPHVWHVRDWFQEFRTFWPPYSAYMRGFSHKIIAVSHAIAEQFSSRENVVVIHNGFSLEEFDVPRERLRAEVRTRYDLGDHFVVGCVGRIKLVRKGQEVLVRAVARLKKRGRRLKALIVGAPFRGNESHLEHLQKLAFDLGVDDCVTFTGEMSDPRPAYAAMDAMALTSIQPEPFGGVVMEAMCMGLPVIATRIGGSLDQVLDGATGFLVPPGDAEALADAIEKLMRDAALCRRMGRAAVERIRNDFSLPEMARKIERVFEEAVATRKRRG